MKPISGLLPNIPTSPPTSNSKSSELTTTKTAISHGEKGKTGTALGSIGATTRTAFPFPAPQEVANNLQSPVSKDGNAYWMRLYERLALNVIDREKLRGTEEADKIIAKADQLIAKLGNQPLATSKQIITHIEMLCQVLNQQAPTDLALDIYITVLGQYPSDTIKTSFERLVKVHKWPTFPKPADFLDVIADDMNEQATLFKRLQMIKNFIR
jgi:hypothetical protein